jgi:hypothetical protein
MNVQGGPPPPQSSPTPNTADLADQRLIIVVGEADSEYGRTRLELDGTGAATVVNQHADDRSTFEGQVSVEEAQAILRSFPSTIEATRKARPGIPDEALYRIEQVAGEKTLVSADIWEGQIESSPTSRKLIEVLRQIVANVTDRQAVL